MSAKATSLFLSSTLTSSARSVSAAGINWGRYALLGLCTVIAAVLANTLFYYLASAVVAYDPDFLPLANAGGTIIMTVAPAIVAVLLYGALLRFTRRPVRIFSVISAIVFVVTLVPDLSYIPTVPGSTPAQIAVLLLMHVIAASVIVRLLTSVGSSQR